MEKTRAEPYVVTYLHQKGRREGLPIAGNFELTARCNFRCPMCYVHMEENQIQKTGQELTAEQWLALARQARDQGMLFVLLTGGEPLLRKDFFQIYRGLKEMGLMISINTNGSLLSGKILEQFLEDPPLRFNISLYGGSNDTYRSMCGLPVYEQAKENIRALRQAGVEVSLNLSVTPYNCQDMEKIYRDAEELNVNIKASAYMYPPVRLGGEYGCGNRFDPCQAAYWSLQWDKLRFDRQELTQRMQNICALEQVDAQECPVESDEGVRCRAGSTSFWITWDGKMMPCGMMPRPVVYPLQSGFAEAWKSIREQTARIRMPAKCGTCPKRPVCSVCAAVCVTETGEFDREPTYLCQQIEQFVRLCADQLGKEE